MSLECNQAGSQRKEKVMGIKHHRTKDGRKINLRTMSESHLLNTIRLIERRAIEGVTVRVGSIWTDKMDCWEEELYGEDVLEELNYNVYTSELKRRGIKNDSP